MLSGVGYLTSSDNVVAPTDKRYFYWDPRATLDTYNPYAGTLDEDSTFIFHNACFNIAVDIGAVGNHDADRVAWVLYRLLGFNMFWDGEDLLLQEFEYGGETKFREESGDPLQAMEREMWAHCVVDPARFVDVDDLARCLETGRGSTKNSRPSRTSTQTQEVTREETQGQTEGQAQAPAQTQTPAPAPAPTQAQDGSDGFFNLPVETVHMILTLLPSGDVHRARVASRSIATASRADSLPQSFWKSRFLPDREMNFALPIRREGPHDWRALYMGIKKGWTSRSRGYGRLANRKRIWDIISKIAFTFDIQSEE